MDHMHDRDTQAGIAGVTTMTCVTAQRHTGTTAHHHHISCALLPAHVMFVAGMYKPLFQKMCNSVCSSSVMVLVQQRGAAAALLCARMLS